MSSATLEERAPATLGSRGQARSLFAGSESKLRDSVVRLDCSALEVSTPSFADELVLVVLVEAAASKLILVDAPTRTVDYARRSAELRSVADRLEIQFR